MRVTQAPITKASLRTASISPNSTLEKISSKLLVTSIANRLIVSESNRQAAQSTIRTSDEALESAHQTRDRIVAQSIEALLSQANLSPRSMAGTLKE